jgi:hypothetical protein
VEIWILAQALLAPTLVEEFGNAVLEDIKENRNSSNLHLAIAGAGSFMSQAKSMLARYACRGFAGNTKQIFAKGFIDPKINTRITPETKVRVKTDEAEMINNVMPESREVGRNEERGDRIFVPTVTIGYASHDIKHVSKEELIGNIQQATATKTQASAYTSILTTVHQRMWRKVHKVIRSTLNDGAPILAEFMRSQALCGKHWKPGILLFSSVKTPNTPFPHLGREKMQLGTIVELFYIARVKEEKNAISSLASLKSIQVICKSGAGKGSFTGTDKVKIAVLHDILRSRVCACLTSLIFG